MVLFVTINVVSARIRVDGESMEPTLLSGEYVIVNRIELPAGSPETRGYYRLSLPSRPEGRIYKARDRLAG